MQTSEKETVLQPSQNGSTDFLHIGSVGACIFLFVCTQPSFVLAQNNQEEKSLLESIDTLLKENEWQPDPDFKNVKPYQPKPEKKEPTISEQVIKKGLSIGEATASTDTENVSKELLNQTLNKGSETFNSVVGSSLTTSTNRSKARIGYYLNSKGVVTGTGDILMPVENNDGSISFIYLGATARATNHWVGTAGIGQRRTLETEDATVSPWMIGYNVFFEHDLLLDRHLASLGVEAGKNGFLISSNTYVNMRDSNSYSHGALATTGWDIRAKGTPSSTPRLSITGSYAIWNGHVTTFPKQDNGTTQIWSYGLEYKPLPLITTTLGQQINDQGRTNTETKFTFSYQFGVPFSEQTKEWYALEHRRPSFLHDFVNRDNLLIHQAAERKQLSSPTYGYSAVSNPYPGTYKDEKLLNDVQAILDKK